MNVKTAFRIVVPLAVLALACADEPRLTGPENEEPAPTEAESPRFALACMADVRAGTLACTPPAPTTPAGMTPALVVGGQGEYVRLASTNVCYEDACADGSAGDELFRADVTVQNLMGQSLGTLDGVTPDPGGIRVFFHAGPTVTQGTGTVGVANPDGTGTFTGAGQPYFEYAGILATEETTDAKTWMWSVPASVEVFEFAVYVSAAVQDEEALGKVAVDPNTVVAGLNYSCALTTEGAAYCWGRNEHGQLGDGTTTDRSFPVEVIGGHVWATLSAEDEHTCGVTVGGAAYCWGVNDDGQLGDGTTTTSASPVLVQGGHSFASIAVSRSHTCAITTGAVTYCWGDDEFGKLGNGSDPGSLTPVEVAGGHTFTSIDAGLNYTCGLEADGDMYCWGHNGSGQLGNGTADSVDEPAPVDQSVTGPITRLAAGAATTCGIAEGGAAYCWGSDINAEMGDGDGVSIGSAVPVAVAGGHDFASIVMGLSHGCGITTDGDAYCWGYNGNGAVGDGAAVTNRDVPTATTGGHAWAAVAAGGAHTCGVTTDNELYCWGNGEYGRLGIGSTGPRVVPTLAGVPLFESVTAGGQHSCGLNVDGEAFCWGLNSDGQLGDGTFDDRLFPVPVAGAHSFIQLSAGRFHTCGLTDDRDAYCWGENGAHQLGDGGAEDRATPTLVANALTWSTISAGDSHTCGVTDAGDAYCWGDPGDGRLGTGAPVDPDNAVPLAVAGGHAFSDIAAGAGHTCGTVPSEDFAFDIYCWGDNGSRQLGTGTIIDSDVPVQVAVDLPISAIWNGVTVGSSHSCGVTFVSSSRVMCWGRGADGELGRGAAVDSSGVPASVAGDVELGSLTAGFRYTCALSSEDEAYCWGDNAFGQLGKGDAGAGTDADAPVAVAGGRLFDSLVAGRQHACGVEADPVSIPAPVYCWGDNESGQLGNGSTELASSPALVTAVAGVQWATP